MVVPMSHTCHAIDCRTPVPPRLLMCLKHWRMVPRDLQRLVWRHYRPGQEMDKRPTAEYLTVMKRAIDAVAMQSRVLSGEANGAQRGTVKGDSPDGQDGEKAGE